MTTIHDMHMSEVGFWSDGYSDDMTTIQRFLDDMEADLTAKRTGCPIDVVRALIALRK